MPCNDGRFNVKESAWGHALMILLVQEIINKLDSLGDTIHLTKDLMPYIKTDTISREMIHHLDSVSLFDFSLPSSPLISTGFLGKEMPLSASNNSVIAVLLLFGFFLFFYLIISRARYIAEEIKRFFIDRDRGSLFDQNAGSVTYVNFCFVTLFVISVGVILFRIVYFEAESQSMGLIDSLPEHIVQIIGWHHILPLVFLSLTACYLILRSLILRFLKFVFLAEEPQANRLLHNYFQVLYLLGVFFYPVAVLIVFAPARFFYPLEYLILISIVFAFLLIIYKICQIFLSRSHAFLYILLYLCTLEFMPVLFLLKAVGFL